jgi:gp32 DNA binding protein like
MSKSKALLAMLNQYENSSNNNSNNKNKKTYNLSNYFTTHLKPNEKEATKRIRIIPTLDDSSPFKEIFGHKFQVDGQWKTFVCMKHTENQGEDCPFCEAYDTLKASNKESHKEFAKKYYHRKMYVVKIIDRDHEDEGVKFWRFNFDYTKKGVFDKIFDLLKIYEEDINDAENGRDLMVKITRNAAGASEISNIQAHPHTSPLSTNKELANQWLNDERTWRDVYSVKPYEYLSILVQGGVPAWDKDNKRYYDSKTTTTKSENETEVEEELVLTPTVKANVQAAKAAPASMPKVSNDEFDDEGDVDDMPF